MLIYSAKYVNICVSARAMYKILNRNISNYLNYSIIVSVMHTWSCLWHCSLRNRLCPFCIFSILNGQTMEFLKTQLQFVKFSKEYIKYHPILAQLWCTAGLSLIYDLHMPLQFLVNQIAFLTDIHVSPHAQCRYRENGNILCDSQHNPEDSCWRFVCFRSCENYNHV